MAKVSTLADKKQGRKSGKACKHKFTMKRQPLQHTKKCIKLNSKQAKYTLPHTHTHAHARTHAHTHTSTHTHMYAHTHVGSCTHTYAHTRMHLCSRLYRYGAEFAVRRALRSTQSWLLCLPYTTMRIFTVRDILTEKQKSGTAQKSEI